MAQVVQSVRRVCVCVCVWVCVRVVIFAQNDLWPRYLAYWFILTLSVRSSKVMTIRQSWSSRSWEGTRAHQLLGWPTVDKKQQKKLTANPKTHHGPLNMLLQELSCWDWRPFGHSRHGPTSGGCCVPFRGGAGSQSNTMSPGPRPTSAASGIDPSGRLATMHQRYRQDRQDNGPVA